MSNTMQYEKRKIERNDKCLSHVLKIRYPNIIFACYKETINVTSVFDETNHIYTKKNVSRFRNI